MRNNVSNMHRLRLCRGGAVQVLIDMFWALPGLWLVVIGAAIVAIVTALLQVSRDHASARIRTTVSWGLILFGAALVLAPAIWQTAAARPYDNHGAWGLLQGLVIYVPLAAAISAAAAALIAGIAAVPRALTPGRAVVVRQVRPAVVVFVLCFIPLASFGMWFAVGMYQTG